MTDADLAGDVALACRILARAGLASASLGHVSARSGPDRMLVRCRGPHDTGLHSVCAVMTAEFLAFSKAAGNDLSTPVPQYGFAGLKPGDRWCLCAPRWKEALDADAAPKVVLEATHEETLAIVPLGVLKDHAVEA